MKIGKCEICEQSKMLNFSFQASNGMIINHFFCNNCKAHMFRGIWYTKEQWDKNTDE